MGKAPTTYLLLDWWKVFLLSSSLFLPFVLRSAHKNWWVVLHQRYQWRNHRGFVVSTSFFFFFFFSFYTSNPMAGAARLSKHLHALPLSVSLTRTSKEGCPVSGLCEQEGQSKRSPKNVSTESFNWWTHKHHTNLLGLRRREVLHKVGSRSQETSTRWEEKKTWQTKLSTLCCLWIPWTWELPYDMHCTTET